MWKEYHFLLKENLEYCLIKHQLIWLEWLVTSEKLFVHGYYSCLSTKPFQSVYPQVSLVSRSIILLARGKKKSRSIISSIRLKYFFSGHFAESACFLLKIINYKLFMYKSQKSGFYWFTYFSYTTYYITPY